MTNPGECERTKAAVHGALGLLAGVCLIYNAVAWYRRREWHLAVNAAVYGALTAYEVEQCRHHATASDCYTSPQR